MLVLKGTYQNGTIKLDQPLSSDLEGKKIELIVQDTVSQKHRQSGTAKGQIWISPDFDEPLEEFQPYM